MRVQINGICTKVFCEILNYLEGLNIYLEVDSINSGTFNLCFDINEQFHIEIDGSLITIIRKHFDYFMQFDREDFGNITFM